MKHGYTEEEYRSLREIRQEEEEPAYKGTGSGESPERERARRRAAAAGKKQATVLTLAVVLMLLVMCGIVAAVSVLLRNNRADRGNAAEEKTVLTVDGEPIGADVFRLFCVNVIESEEFGSMVRNAVSDSALQESVKEKAVTGLEDYVCLYREAEKAGMMITEEEMSSLRAESEAAASAAGADPATYYRTHYGISPEQYVRVRANWMLAGKYAAFLRDQCDLSEEALRAVYEKNYARFAEADVTMVYFDTSSGDESANGFKRSNAETVYNSICSLSEDGIMTADETVLTAAVREWSDPNCFFETGSGADGRAVVNGEAAAQFPVLFETVITMQEGEVRLVKDEAAVFIVRCDARRLFESCRESDELKELAQEQYIADTYREARNSGRYRAVLTAEYYATDIAQYVAEGKRYYGR